MLETGGILLGHKIGILWIIMDVIPSGKDAFRSPYHFSMDEAYANTAVAAALEHHPTYRVFGIWHKHNHNLRPSFSDDDMNTNFAFAKLNPFGAISLLASKVESHYLLQAIYCTPQKKTYPTIILSHGKIIP